MSYLLEDIEQQPVVGPGEDINAIVNQAAATGTTVPVKTEAETGQQVVDANPVNPNTGMAPRTGAEAAKDFTHDYTHDLLSEDEQKKAAKALYDFGTGKDIQTDAVDPLTGTSRTGLPAWYQAAKLRGAKVPGSKNSHYLLDEKTWEPPSENKLGKGIAGMIANMSTAGSRVAMNEKSRPLALRMKDANRVALGEGAAMLADTLFGRKRDRYEDLLKTAKTESEIEKNRATATKGGKGAGSGDATRISALRGVIEADLGKSTGDRLERKDVAANEQAQIDADPRHPKAAEFRQHILESTGGWLNENDVPHASYAELLKLEPRLGEEAARRSQADVKRIDREWEEYSKRHGANEASHKAFVAQQEEIAKQRRDNWLEAGEFWRSGSPPKDPAVYQKVREYHGLTNNMMETLTQLSEIQDTLTKMGTLYGAGGEVIKYLGGKMGMEKAQYLTNLGFQLAANLRNTIRKKDNFGVPQEWEQQFLRTQVLEPGSFMAWLQGTSSFDSLYEITKKQARQWLRDVGGIGFTDTDKEPAKYTGPAPVRISEPVVRDRHGKPLKSWEEIRDVGADDLDQLLKYGERLTEEKKKEKGWTPPVREPAPAPAAAATKDKTAEALATGILPIAKGVASHLTKATKDFAEELKHLTAADWTEDLAKEWKQHAIDIKDRALQAFTNLPYNEQLRQFFGTEGEGDKHVEVVGPVRRAPKANALPNKPAEPQPEPEQDKTPSDKKPTRWRITHNGKPFATKEKIPDGASPADANAAFQKGLKNVPEEQRGEFGLEGY